jgi:TolB protein
MNQLMNLSISGLLLISLITCSCQQDREYLIAYNVLVDADIDNYDIFSMNMDGSNKTNITNNNDVAWSYLAWTNTIFFLSDRDTIQRTYFLYEMLSNGSSVKRISHFRMQDSWMGIRDDGNELIVKPHNSVDTLLYIINRSGEILQKIATGTRYASDPAFSPDGKRIAFIGSNKKSKKEAGFKAEIYSVNTDGTDLMQLSQYPQGDTTAEWYAYKAGPPRWQPKEDFITFQSKQNGKYSLYAVSYDGSKQWKLTDNPQEEGWHDWSPDGKWLAIELFDNKQSQFHIGLMNWQTKEMKILTDTTYQYQQAPVFVEKYK